jgi:hypothetical protein
VGLTGGGPTALLEQHVGAIGPSAAVEPASWLVAPPSSPGEPLPDELLPLEPPLDEVLPLLLPEPPLEPLDEPPLLPPPSGELEPFESVLPHAAIAAVARANLRPW